MRSRSFSLKLWERVLQMTCWTFVSTYMGALPVGGAQHLIPQIAGMTPAQRALVAALGGVLQFIVGAGIAPHVGDPNTPDLIPGVILKRFGVPQELEPLEVTLSEVIEATVHAVKSHPDSPVTVEDVAKEIALGHRRQPPAESA